MSAQNQKIVVGGLAGVAVLVMAWVLWSQLGGEGRLSGSDTVKEAVLCGDPKCGFSGEMAYAELKTSAGIAQAARAPVYGPGYKCTKCGKDTLYTNPTACAKCNTRFLTSRDASGYILDKCPKCGWER